MRPDAMRVESQRAPVGSERREKVVLQQIAQDRICLAE